MWKLILGAAIGFCFAYLLMWGQQFGGKAMEAETRREMDRKRKEEQEQL